MSEQPASPLLVRVYNRREGNIVCREGTIPGGGFLDVTRPEADFLKVHFKSEVDTSAPNESATAKVEAHIAELRGMVAKLTEENKNLRAMALADETAEKLSPAASEAQRLLHPATAAAKSAATPAKAPRTI
jgi:hypothetical protein